MITQGDTESGGDQQKAGHCEVKPIDSELPEVPWHCGKRKNKRPDQERARDPINPVNWYPKMQSFIGYLIC